MPSQSPDYNFFLALVKIGTCVILVLAKFCLEINIKRTIFNLLAIVQKQCLTGSYSLRLAAYLYVYLPSKHIKS